VRVEACRGTDAGFVHLACLTNYLAAKSVQACDTTEFREPWYICPNCHQYYQNELAVDIASKFVSFVRRQYPDNTQTLPTVGVLPKETLLVGSGVLISIGAGVGAGGLQTSIYLQSVLSMIYMHQPHRTLGMYHIWLMLIHQCGIISVGACWRC
jgi:hypothetical protein